jgi:hypothetical protein
MLRVMLAAALIAAVPARAQAHCDTLDGPVVTAAREALEKGDVKLVLHWVRPGDEAAVRDAFRRAVAVRRLGPDARELADHHFFETVVRVHRAGEGAPYTGLSAGAPDPIITATDRALQRGDAAEVEALLVAEVRRGLARRFAAARAARSFRQGDVAAGRAFVAAYVPLTHWVEAVFAAAGDGAAHAAEPPAAHAH